MEFKLFLYPVVVYLLLYLLVFMASSTFTDTSSCITGPQTELKSYGFKEGQKGIYYDNNGSLIIDIGQTQKDSSIGQAMDTVKYYWDFILTAGMMKDCNIPKDVLRIVGIIHFFIILGLLVWTGWFIRDLFKV